MAESKLSVKDWKPINGAGKARGTCTVDVAFIRIKEVMIVDGANGVFASLPSKPMIDRDGRVIMREGKRSYVNLLEFLSKDIAARFSNDVVAALRAQGVALGDSAPLRQDELAGMLDRA